MRFDYSILALFPPRRSCLHSSFNRYLCVFQYASELLSLEKIIPFTIQALKAEVCSLTNYADILDLEDEDFEDVLSTGKFERSA